MNCPGQDTRNWKSDDIFEVPCPACGRDVELFKDESSRRCSACGQRVGNPRLDLGCAAHCPHGAECLAAGGVSPAR